MTDNALNAPYFFMLELVIYTLSRASVFQTLHVHSQNIVENGEQVGGLCEGQVEILSKYPAFLICPAVKLGPPGFLSTSSSIEASFIWLMKQFFRKLCRRWSVVWRCWESATHVKGSTGQVQRHFVFGWAARKSKTRANLCRRNMWWKLNLTVFWLQLHTVPGSGWSAGDFGLRARSNYCVHARELALWAEHVPHQRVL